MVAEYFINIVRTFTTVLNGMAVTLSWCFRRPNTVQWPDKIDRPVEETLPERYRGILETDLRICTACLACQTACPINCIAITVAKDEQTKERFLTRFDIDAAKCMYCGLCVENCPTEAIRHTTLFAASKPRVEDLCLRFIKPGERKVPFKPKAEKPEPAPRGSITREALKANDATDGSGS